MLFYFLTNTIRTVIDLDRVTSQINLDFMQKPNKTAIASREKADPSVVVLHTVSRIRNGDWRLRKVRPSS